MTVPLTGAGSLGVRLGHIFGGLADDLALQGFAATARVLNTAFWTTRETTIVTDYTGGTADSELLTGDNGFGQPSGVSLFGVVDAWNSTFTQKFASLGTLAANTVIKMCDRDASPNGLQSRTLPFALAYLINQMTNGSTSFNATTVSVGAQTALGTPTGNATVVVTSLNGLGQTLQYSFSETLTFKCTADSYTGGQTANQEQLTCQGQAAITPAASYLWPGGSGISKVFNAVSPLAYNSGAQTNLLTNGDFLTFTNTNYPDNWAITVGAATTNFLKVTTPLYLGTTNSLEIVGDSSTLSAINQSFNTAVSTSSGAGGTPAKLVAQTLYCANLFYQLSGASPAAGVLALEVVDGNNAIINDTQAVAQTTNVNLHTIADTNWHALNLVFRLPAAPPVSPTKLRIRLSTALTTGTNVYIAGVSCTPMVGLYGGNAPMYNGGPSVAAFAGNTKLLLADTWTIAYTPTWGTFQQYFERLFSMKSLGLQFPSSGSPTVADSLVT